MSTKRVLLTGLGGSIGCHVLRHILANTDWDVVGIDSFRHKGLTDRVRLMIDPHPETAPRLKIITHDLKAPISDLMAREIGPVDYIINVASLSDVHASIENPRPFIEGNVALITTMLEYARTYGCKAFLQLSTDEVYGPTDGKTLHKEWDPILPSNPYSASKAAQEAIAISYWRAYNVPLIIVNLMNNFGEMQSAAKFPAIVQRKTRLGEEITIHGTEQTVGSRVYIHSRNSADAFVFLLKNVKPHIHVNGQTDRPDRFNIVGDRQVRNDELVELISGWIGKPAKYHFEPPTVSRPGHDLHYGLDGAKLRALGWSSPVSFEDSMQETVRWYEDHPEWLEKRT
jgi:dTDP-glucose 4,6-dehydratase